jgi:hypothetical protein
MTRPESFLVYIPFLSKEVTVFQNNLSLYQNTQLPGKSSAESMYARQYNAALNRFNAALGKGKFARLKRRILQHPQSLYDLNALNSDLGLYGSVYSGIQVVAIHSIIGSEGRTTGVDDAYFVRDGRHSISVSRAFGQLAMDAEVITWKAQPPFPCQSARKDVIAE